MPKISKKKLVSIIVIVIIIIIAILVYAFIVKQNKALRLGSTGVKVTKKTSTPVSGGGPVLPGGATSTGGTATSTPKTPDWLMPDNPNESRPLSAGEVPEGAIKIVMSAKGIDPSSFTVKRGQKVTLSITSGDKWTHIFKFEDKSLSKVAIGLSPHETRAITFYAPDTAGDYTYYCDVPGHKARGEVGKMIVK